MGPAVTAERPIQGVWHTGSATLCCPYDGMAFMPPTVHAVLVEQLRPHLGPDARVLLAGEGAVHGPRGPGLVLELGVVVDVERRRGGLAHG